MAVWRNPCWVSKYSWMKAQWGWYCIYFDQMKKWDGCKYTYKNNSNRFILNHKRHFWFHYHLTNYFEIFRLQPDYWPQTHHIPQFAWKKGFNIFNWFIQNSFSCFFGSPTHMRILITVLAVSNGLSANGGSTDNTSVQRRLSVHYWAYP